MADCHSARHFKYGATTKLFTPENTRKCNSES